VVTLNDCKRALINYGLGLMAHATRGDAPALRQQLGGSWPDYDWSPYERVLIGQRDLSPPQQGERLLSIFSRVRLPEAEAQPPLVYYCPHLLELDRETLFPADKNKPTDPKREVTWGRFVEAVTRVMETDREGEALFETFYHLMYRHAWALPCTYGEEGVSLFEQWKAVAALAFATGEKWADGPGDKFTLIGGDIPGIQDFVYTITSKGAAKGLRGRSFFVQLLGDAVVRRLLTDLELCSANVVYNAGGNFIVLGPRDSQATLQEWQAIFNRVLLDEFEGDLYLALAWEELPRSAAGMSAFADVRERLGAKVTAAKNRRFAEVVKKDGWEALFQPQGQGGLEYCQVCQREPRPGDKLVEETTEAGETVRKCAQCRSFETLARDIAYDKLWTMVTEASEAARREKGWRGTLARLTGFAYCFEHEPLKVSEPGTIYILNDTNLERAGAHGFRFIANVTPRIEEVDRQWVREHHPDLEVPSDEYIKDFALMALQSQGIPRVGVLRMDVDGLGRVFSEGVPDLSLPKLSTLSGALDLFFGGYLNVLVRTQAENNLYVIYAGGDDLFIVGAWHHLPDLAEAIRNEFKAFTGDHPALSLSGGITLEGAKFPLYRAAERAEEAERQAKGYKRSYSREEAREGEKAEGDKRPKEHEKDAFSFLDMVVGWEDWKLVRQQKDNLLWLIGEDEENQSKREDERERRLPRALLQMVQSIHQLYRTGLRDAQRRVRRANRKRKPDKKLPLPNPQMFFGRWAWMQVYSLTQLAQRSKDDEAKARIMELQKQIMQPATVCYSGLAARWAEYFTRRPEH